MVLYCLCLVLKGPVWHSCSQTDTAWGEKSGSTKLESRVLSWWRLCLPGGFQQYLETFLIVMTEGVRLISKDRPAILPSLLQHGAAP